ncbi:MAG: GTP pyrophosphokinase [Anaerolineales bacterium]|nr:MAG: GTP pyrophosphokinase [Anaerolineales bacterium]
MATLEDAILLAVQAHQGQKDKAGAPYILHPLRVMFRMGSDVEMMVAILHDVLEDTQYTLLDLQQAGYLEQVLEALDCLTRRENETYEEFIERVETNPLARKVKIADLEDNMDIRRISAPQEKDMERLKRYRRAWSALTKEPVQGDSA